MKTAGIPESKKSKYSSPAPTNKDASQASYFGYGNYMTKPADVADTMPCMLCGNSGFIEYGGAVDYCPNDNCPALNDITEDAVDEFADTAGRDTGDVVTSALHMRCNTYFKVPSVHNCYDYRYEIKDELFYVVGEATDDVDACCSCWPNNHSILDIKRPCLDFNCDCKNKEGKNI